MKTRKLWTNIAKGYVTPTARPEIHDDDDYNARMDGERLFGESGEELQTRHRRRRAGLIALRETSVNQLMEGIQTGAVLAREQALDAFSRDDLIAEVNARNARLGEAPVGIAGGTHRFDPNLVMTPEQLRTLEQLYYQAVHSMDAGRLRIATNELSPENRRKLFAAVIASRYRHREGVRSRNQAWQRGDMVKGITNQGEDINGALIGGGNSAKIIQLGRSYNATRDCQWHTLEKLGDHKVRLVPSYDNKTFSINPEDEARMLAIFAPSN